MEIGRSHLIKRYANRKLYDTDRSRYVTLEQIAEMVREGEEVKIVDYRTQEDITSGTLAQMVFEKEKRQLPTGALLNIIQQGSDALGQFGKRVTKTYEEVREGAEKGIERLERLVTERLGRREDVARQLRDWYRASQQSLGELQRRAEEQLDRSLGTAFAPHTALRAELQEIHREVKALQARLTALSDKLPPEKASGDDRRKQG